MPGDQPVAVSAAGAEPVSGGLDTGHRPALLLLATALTGGARGRARGVAQETIRRAWTCQATLGIEHRSLRAWLITVVQPRAVNVRGGRRVRPAQAGPGKHLALAGGQRADASIDEGGWGVRQVMVTLRDWEPPAQLTDRALAAEVTAKAQCADGTVDPDEWFPVSTEAEAARREAAGAIAICTACPVRGACLELSLRQWTIGQHGVWGGLVAADRAALRRRWLASPHEYGHALPILDRIWDGPPATSHAGRDRPATAAGTPRRALPSMRAARMARALLRHLTAAAPARDPAPPGGRSIPPAASVPQTGQALARPIPAAGAADAAQQAHARTADTGARQPAGAAQAWPIQAGAAVSRRPASRNHRAAGSGDDHCERDTRPPA